MSKPDSGYKLTKGKSDEALNMLRSRVKSLRAKSKTLVRRESELKQYLAKLSETQKKTKLTTEDKTTMQDILMIQQWLLTIKRQRNFGRFRDVVADMKRQIFTPAQVKKRTESKSDLRVSAVTEGMTDIDDSMQASIMKKYERIEEQPPSNQPANLASNVSFVNGRWVKLGGEDKAVEDEGDENALDDLSDFGDDDDDAAPKARPDDLDGLSGFGDSDEDEDATTNKNGSSNAHHERSMSGPSGRQLHEFELSEELQGALGECETQHNAAFTACFEEGGAAVEVLSSLELLNNEIQLQWMLTQARLMTDVQVAASNARTVNGSTQGPSGKLELDGSDEDMDDWDM